MNLNMLFTQKKNALFALMALVIFTFLLSCKGGPSEKELTDDSDETIYISDEFLEDEIEESDDYEYIDDGNDNNSSFSGILEAPDSYKNYVRTSDAPEEFAKAAVWHAVQMIYPEPFANAQVEVLSSNKVDDRLSIQMKITWSDRWAGPYIIEGVLEVNTDGSNGVFTITSKNLNAESLEFTHEGAVNTKQLPVL